MRNFIKSIVYFLIGVGFGAGLILLVLLFIKNNFLFFENKSYKLKKKRIDNSSAKKEFFLGNQKVYENEKFGFYFFYPQEAKLILGGYIDEEIKKERKILFAIAVEKYDKVRLKKVILFRIEIMADKSVEEEANLRDWEYSHVLGESRRKEIMFKGFKAVEISKKIEGYKDMLPMFCRTVVFKKGNNVYALEGCLKEGKTILESFSFK